MVKPWESAYSTFNNNPIFYIDPNGRDGEATVDKENKTVSIKMDFHYSETGINNKDYGSNGIGSYGENIERYKTEMIAEYSKVNCVQIDGEDYTVSFTFNFIPHGTDEERDKAVKNDPTANMLLFTATTTDPDKLNAGGWWNNDNRSITKVLGRGGADVMPHEAGHGLGLDHAKADPHDPVFGDERNGLGKTVEGSGLMSYTVNKGLQAYEVKIIVQRAVNIANTVNDNIVKIHLTGKGHFDVDPKSNYGQQIIKAGQTIGNSNISPIYLGKESSVIK